MTKLTHIDEHGQARMVDTTNKEATTRQAIASGRVLMSAKTIQAIRDHQTPKGDPLETARLAGILAAKRTADLIPLCHPLALTSIKVDLTIDKSRNAVDIEASCKLFGRTGVEMEALTAVSVAALTVYDMCKAVDRGMTVTDIRLTAKSGGKSGSFEAA